MIGLKKTVTGDVDYRFIFCNGNNQIASYKKMATPNVSYLWFQPVVQMRASFLLWA
jgi:hypothetical protein